MEVDREVLDDLPTLVAAARRGKVEDVQELVMFHQTLKSASSVVRMIIGRVIVQRWMMVLGVRRYEILVLTKMVRGLATILTILVMKMCSPDSFQVDPLCGAVVSPVQDDDECEAHAAFLVDCEGSGVLDSG